MLVCWFVFGGFGCYLSLATFLCGLVFSGFDYVEFVILVVDLLRFVVCLNLNVCWVGCLFELYMPVFWELGVFTHFLAGWKFLGFYCLVFGFVCGIVGFDYLVLGLLYFIVCCVLWFDVSFWCLG